MSNLENTKEDYTPVPVITDYWRLKADPSKRYASGHTGEMYRRAIEEFGVPEDESYKAGEYCPEARPVATVLKELNKEMNQLFDESSFYNQLQWTSPNALWPLRYRWIAVFPVTGGNEGHYVHIEVLFDEKRTLIGTCKTFQGWDHACQLAAVAGKILGA